MIHVTSSLMESIHRIQIVQFSEYKKTDNRKVVRLFLFYLLYNRGKVYYNICYISKN